MPFLGLIRTVFKAPCHRQYTTAVHNTLYHPSVYTALKQGDRKVLCVSWKNTSVLGSYIAFRGISSSKARIPNVLEGLLLKQPPGQVRCCSGGGGGSGVTGGGRGAGVAAERCPPELEALYHGNQQFRATVEATSPGLLKTLALEGQKPPFMLLNCADSRVGEQAIFSVKPGTMFTTRNIANQYNENDLNSKSVLSYAVNVLGVKHVIVMGHYGCGGVAAAIMPKVDDNAVQLWIDPIRRLYEQSTRPEIVVHREKYGLTGLKDIPHLHDPVFRALVEENVKANVLRVARSSVITGRYDSLASEIPKLKNEIDPISLEVFIHGWVYDIETGEVRDLGVSVGPPGKGILTTPFPVLENRHTH